MNTKSCKAKGRHLQNLVRDKILSKYPSLKKDDDVRSTIMGESGTDIKLSTEAKRVFPYSIECKNQEKINIWSALDQAERNKHSGTTSLVVFKRNHSKIYAVLEWEDFLRLIH